MGKEDDPMAVDAAAPTLHLNDDTLPWQSGQTLAALLTAHGYSPNAVATAVNGRFVPRAARTEQLLAAGDHVTVFAAITGG